MTSEVVIDVKPKDISIALLEDKNLVEYQNETRSASFSVGNIYIAKVKKLMPIGSAICGTGTEARNRALKFSTRKALYLNTSSSARSTGPG